MLHMKRYILSICAFASIGCTLNAATLFVTNVLDNGNPGSLRETIANASSGDSILFSIAGTIILDETRGELVVDKQLTIDGQNKITIDGADLINICFHITGANASSSLITNIAIQHFNGHDVTIGTTTELPAHGVLIDNGATYCSVSNTTIRHINSGVGEEAIGIFSNEIIADITNNTIMFVSSENNPTSQSGAAVGILLSTDINGSCTNNIISDVSSGNSENRSGSVVGIAGENSNGEVSHNTLYNFTSGTSLDEDSGEIFGILINTANSNCSHNTLYNFITQNAENNSGAIIGIQIVTLNGICSDNILYNFTTGVPLEDNSGSITGIEINTIEGDCARNTMHTFTSAHSNTLSGTTTGIAITTLQGTISHNILDNFKSGTGNDPSASTVFGIQVNIANGNCTYNKVTNCIAGNTVQGGTVIGMAIDSINGNCSYNTIEHLTSTRSGFEQEVIGIRIVNMQGVCLSNQITKVTLTSDLPLADFVLIGGIQVVLADDTNVIACNMVEHISGDGGTVFGIEIREGTALTITKNSINAIENRSGPAYGILLGRDSTITTFVTNSLIDFNIISSICGAAKNGYGITLVGINSIGNDILSNSIFSINGKAINIIANGVPVDATVVLNSVRCNRNCSLVIRGQLLPSTHLVHAPQFLIQFFASPDNTPSETKVLIGEYIHDTSKGNTFEATLAPFASTQFGQYLTATATALVEEPHQNLNTSEVSNAIPLCTIQDNHLCPCPPPGTPPVSCPVTCSLL